MGIDVGERRVGIAFSTPEETIALPAGFLEVRTPADAAAQLAEMIGEEGVVEAVVGLPYNMDGSEGYAVRKVKELLTLLQPLVPQVKFRLWDERLTSVQAHDLLTEAELKHTKKRKKGRVDAVAASLILQSYLDTRPTDRNTINRAAGF